MRFLSSLDRARLSQYVALGIVIAVAIALIVAIREHRFAEAYERARELVIGVILSVCRSIWPRALDWLTQNFHGWSDDPDTDSRENRTPAPVAQLVADYGHTTAAFAASPWEGQVTMTQVTTSKGVVAVLSTDAQQLVADFQKIASSPIGGAVLTELKAYTIAAADQLVDGYIAMELAKSPGQDASTLTAAVDGDLKHYVRTKIAFGADLLFAIEGPAISAYVSDLVAANQATATVAPQQAAAADQTAPSATPGAVSGGTVSLADAQAQSEVQGEASAVAGEESPA